jgi:hypothetical protein
MNVEELSLGLYSFPWTTPKETFRAFLGVATNPVFFGVVDDKQYISEDDSPKWLECLPITTVGGDDLDEQGSFKYCMSNDES